MKQLVQNMKSGETRVEEIPAPCVREGHVLIKSVCSLVSVGTEKMLVDFAKANLVEKALQQPERVRQVLRKVHSDGFRRTAEAVSNKLDTPLPLGYCNVGVVTAVGSGVTGFHVGERVASNGPHAEVVCVPKNLVARIPDNVTNEEAAFTVIGSVALQGIRLLKVEFGETVVVFGLGLVGLLACQILKASGCRVLGIEVVHERAEMARKWGMTVLETKLGEDVPAWVLGATAGVGADAILITASTRSNEIIERSARMARKRGRIVLVGVVGLQLDRSEFYRKELTFQVSCSYGPGRYDPRYELEGLDYPLPFVRWTENRNFQAVLDGISAGALHVAELVSEEIPLDEYQVIYENFNRPSVIASILRYDEHGKTESLSKIGAHSGSGTIASWIIGAGNFTRVTLLPILKKLNAIPRGIVSLEGVSGTALAGKYGIDQSSTDFADAVADVEANTLIIATRHNLHAEMVVRALNAGKSVFVEKPLCIEEDELGKIVDAYRSADRPLNVGYNRRFSPFARRAKKLLRDGESINVVMTVNAGFIPRDSWVHDPTVGGGRIVGEACHFVDLATFFAGSLVTEAFMSGAGTSPDSTTDEAILALKYENGSQAVINYFANGHGSYPKERVEIYSGNRVLVIDDWRSLTGFGVSSFRKMSSKSDKGHRDEFQTLVRNCGSSDGQLIPFQELVNTSRAVFACLRSLTSGNREPIDPRF